MPRKNKYVKTSAKKTNFKTIFKKFSGFLVSIIMFVAVLYLSNFFSNLLTIKTISNLSFQASTKDITVYAVSVFNSTKRQEAVDFAESVKTRLAAGYIQNNNGVYDVLASAYITETEAKNVADKLEKNGEVANVIKITLNGISLNLNLTDKAKDTMKENLSMFYNSFNSLQTISLEFDKSNFDVIKTKNEILTLIEQNKLNFKKFSDQFTSNNNVKIAYIKLFLSKLNETISELLDITDDVKLGWQIKYKYFECLSLYKNLQKEI